MRKATLLLVFATALSGCLQSRDVGGGTPGTARVLCGNGVVDVGELCDPCPTSCDDGIACTNDTLVGSGCRASCEYETINQCIGGDSCCPNNCNASVDGDCSATCGDGTVDENETCDGDCEACVAPDACTTVTEYGSANNCTLECAYSSGAQCGAADGCCPPACSSAQDPDCMSSCGDGIVDPGETCDGDCVDACPTTQCTTAMLVGSALTCTATCTFDLITMCANGDGCCPTGCEEMDDDCDGPLPSGDVGSTCTDQPTCQAALENELATCLPFTDGYCTIVCDENLDCPGDSRCDIDLSVCGDTCDVELQDCRSGYTCRQSLDVTESPYFTCLPAPE